MLINIYIRNTINNLRGLNKNKLFYTVQHRKPFTPLKDLTNTVGRFLGSSFKVRFKLNISQHANKIIIIFIIKVYKGNAWHKNETNRPKICQSATI